MRVFIEGGDAVFALAPLEVPLAFKRQLRVPLNRIASVQVGAAQEAFDAVNVASVPQPAQQHAHAAPYVVAGPLTSPAVRPRVGPIG